MAENQSQPRIVVIGAGVGGLSFAVNLRRKLPEFDNFVIYEKANDVGGTWRSNTYPGCSSDIPSHFFSLSTDLNPDWDYTHAKQPQFHGYWKSVARKYDLYPNLKFNTLVTSAVWNPSKSKYLITTRLVKDDISKMHVRGQGVLVQEEEDTPGEQQDEADILISALGILEVIRCPDIPGLDTFKGNIFHSGAWDHTVELKGKRVGVIGNGASATQFIPIISKDPSVKVTVICRTPNWFVPPIRAKYSTLRKWMFRNVPLFMRLHRLYYFLITDMFYMSVFANVWIRKLARRVCKAYILSTAPKKYHDKLIPSYTLGCKRVIFDTNYLNCLHRPNVDLNWNEIGSIIEDGIITKTGDKLPFEVLIFATGFISDDYPLHVKGTLETVKEFYDRNGGPTAYMGTTLPGFPNFYMLTGPNTGTGHTSVIFTEECQIDYMLQMIKPVLRGDLKTVEVTDKATARWNDKIQARLRRSVFVDCVSWYRRDRDGKVTSIFPGFATVFWWWFRRVNWRDYRVSARDPTQWERKQNQKEQWRGFKKVAVFFAVLSISIAILAKGAGKWDFVLDVCTKHLPSSSCPLYRRAKALWGF